MNHFIDRQDAGAQLAKSLKHFAKRQDIIILALPRGGVPVAYEIAKSLNAPLDVFIVRKLGVPGHEELAMGAIASGDTVIFNTTMIQELNIKKTAIQSVLASEKRELARREKLYRGDSPLPSLEGKTIILVDDGVATGSTMHAAVSALRKQKPKAIIIAVPVAPYDICDEMASWADEVICPLQPINFYAVGAWYDNFPQTSDEEVITLVGRG